MALNIKNSEVEQLATEVAELFGETKTEAIRVALLERRLRFSKTLGAKPRELALRFLEEEVWPNLEGRGQPSKAEREHILGLGELGV